MIRESRYGPTEELWFTERRTGALSPTSVATRWGAANHAQTAPCSCVIPADPVGVYEKMRKNSPKARLAAGVSFLRRHASAALRNTSA